MTDDINKILEKRGHKIRVFSIESGLRKDTGIGKVSDVGLEKTMLGGFSRKYIGVNPNIEDILFTRKIYKELDVLTPMYDMLWSNGEYWCAKMVKKLSDKNKMPCLVFFGGGISKMMEKEAKMHPDIFVVLSPVMKEWLDKKVPECNTKCIPSGVDLELFKKIEPLSPKWKYERPIVCTTSALVKGKRINLIIDAMHKLGKGTLFITNDGPMRESIVKKGKRLLKDRFHYLGVLPFKDLSRLYSMSDVFVLASDNEPWGAVILEAMACGCVPVVQLDDTRRFMMEESGIFVPPDNDAKFWGSAISSAYHHKDFFKTRKQAEKFSWDKTVDEYLKAIKEVT